MQSSACRCYAEIILFNDTWLNEELYEIRQNKEKTSRSII